MTNAILFLSFARVLRASISYVSCISRLLNCRFRVEQRRWCNSESAANEAQSHRVSCSCGSFRRDSRAMSGLEILGLAAAGGVAGVMNSIAGGGTLLTFPALMLLGTPAKVANATSTIALLLGTSGSLFGYRNQLATVKPGLARFVPVSALGGWLGGLLLTSTSEQAFRQLVPFLILFATVLFLVQGGFRRFAGFGDAGGEVHPHHRVVWLAVVFQFAVALYGGYFGAGIGILMLASLGFIGLTNIHEMNALKTVLAAIINFVASVWLVLNGLVDWQKAGAMTVGAMTGYFLGSHFAQRIPQRIMRRIITGIGFGISAVMFYRQFSAK